MTEIIVLNEVSKYFQLQSYQPSLRHEAIQIVKRLTGRTKRADWEAEKFWVLKNISFRLHEGDTLGIVGDNGAGKTTLLRVLSGIVVPNSGYVSVRGRFASLIGLGAGFDYELSGLENIYLNAAIQGTSPREIEPLVQGIIDFSEVNEFINQPVKLYSSGMIARLGFSIAFALLPDIIFMDEILAVGDIAFQSKSKNRILELKERRATLVYVSHDLDAVQLLCERSIWLQGGEIVMDGKSEAVIEAYRRSK